MDPAAPRPQRERFIWPPRNPPGAPAPDPAPPRGPARHAQPAPRREQPAPNSPRSALPALKSIWSEVERAWLGLTLAPFAQRAAETGWAPDEPGDYCWRCGASRAGGPINPPGGDDPGCDACRGIRQRWTRVVRLGPYTGLLRDAIHQTKFSAWRRLGWDVGRLLGERLKSALDQAGYDAAGLALVPSPTTLLRRVVRGIDHTAALARAVQSVTGGRIVRALARRHRPSQLNVPVSERQRNVAGTMRVRTRVEGTRVVVVLDDVMTTGATMRECVRALRAGLGKEAAGVEVWAAVLGVTPQTPQPGGRSEGRGGTRGGPRAAGRAGGVR